MDRTPRKAIQVKLGTHKLLKTFGDTYGHNLGWVVEQAVKAYIRKHDTKRQESQGAKKEGV